MTRWGGGGDDDGVVKSVKNFTPSNFYNRYNVFERHTDEEGEKSNAEREKTLRLLKNNNNCRSRMREMRDK